MRPAIFLILMTPLAGCTELGGFGYPTYGGMGGYPYGYSGYGYPGPYRNPYYYNKPPSIRTPQAQARKDLSTIYDHRDQIAKLPPKQRDEVIRYAEELGKKGWETNKRPRRKW